MIKIPLSSLHFRCAALFCSAAFSGLIPARTLAQASSTAGKSADLAVFGGFEGAHPDYGYQTAYGGSFGIDYTRYLRFRVVPSLELRANLVSSVAISERSYLAGFRAVVPFRLAQPYADILIGPGNMHYPLHVTYVGDNSIVYSYGGGVDIPVIRNFALRLDLQEQHWDIGRNLTYTPTLATVGVRYTIPFHSNASPRGYRR